MFVQGQGQKSEQKHRTKNFAKLPNHSPLLTMACSRQMIITIASREFAAKSLIPQTRDSSARTTRAQEKQSAHEQNM